MTTEDWGRVTDDGTVFVRTQEGERQVGQMPDASPAEALAFFTRRFEALSFEVELLEQRVGAEALNPQEATTSITQVRTSIQGAQAVGDLGALLRRLDALGETVAEQRRRRREERAQKVEEARAAKEVIATEAEKLAEGNDWRNGSTRLRDLLDQWKALPRLERPADDALWRRFSSARTTYTRRRKSHFAEVTEKREAAQVVKQRLTKDAEELSSSTDWGTTAGRFRELMREWKAAGPAPKSVDDDLWQRFRTAQDTFFVARDSVNAAIDRELAANAETKRALLVDAEALIPITDAKASRERFRVLAERWDAAGKVPREQVKELEGRMRTVEQAIRSVEDDQWRRSNPEARARAADTVAKLETSIAGLESKRDKAVATGNHKAARDHEEAIAARRSWLTEAQRALDDFS